MPGVEPLKLAPIFKERIWGGHRLSPDSPGPIGEAWIVFDENTVMSGGWTGRTLADVTRELGPDLLGEPVVNSTGQRFPLLVKLLDSRDWLSVQVHPNDEQARTLEGPEYFGKTEAWYVLSAEPDARVVFGLKEPADRSELERRILTGSLESSLDFKAVRSGDTLFTPAGCVHAIGPGLFIYEVQQTSDITYRLYDWNRPQSAGRPLHLEKGLEVVGDCAPADRGPAGNGAALIDCRYFALDRFRSSSVISCDTERRSFHAVTVIEGHAEIRYGAWTVPAGELEAVVIPAAVGRYEIVPDTTCAVLIARVP